MRQFTTALCSAALILGMVKVSTAADLPVRAPPKLPPSPPVYNWTGFYIGGNAGYMWSSNGVDTSSVETFSAPTWNTENDASVALASGSNSVNADSFIGGVQLGYNWQFDPRWLVGIEADLQGIPSGGTSTRSGTAVPAAYPGELVSSTVTASRRVDWLGTVRGRIGGLVNPALLLYATGGLAYGKVKASTAITQQNNPPFPGLSFSSFGSSSQTRAGWTVGGGVEWMFAPRWTAKAEYLYYDLGNVSYSLSPLSLPFLGATIYSNSPSSTTRFDGSIVRVGVNYLF